MRNTGRSYVDTSHLSPWEELLQLPDPLSVLSAQGRVFYAADAASADLVTGQTSHAVTTPTFLLDVPLGIVAIPLQMKLFQAGTVAGADEACGPGEAEACGPGAGAVAGPP